MSALWPRPRCWISVPFREGDGEYLCDLFCAILGKTVDCWWRLDGEVFTTRRVQVVSRAASRRRHMINLQACPVAGEV